MTRAEELEWQRKLSQPDGYLRVVTSDGYYDTYMKFASDLRNDLVNGIKEFLSFESLYDGQILIRSGCVEAIVDIPAERVRISYDAWMEDSIKGN